MGVFKNPGPESQSKEAPTFENQNRVVITHLSPIGGGAYGWSPLGGLMGGAP